jgi:hypothetical protein
MLIMERAAGEPAADVLRVAAGRRAICVQEVTMTRILCVVGLSVLDVYDNIASAVAASVSCWHLAQQNGQRRFVNRLGR